MRIIKLTDKQFEGMEVGTRRSLMEQLMIVNTARYKYSLGSKGRKWIIYRYDKDESIGADKWEEDYMPLEVDSWE